MPVILKETIRPDGFEARELAQTLLQYPSSKVLIEYDSIVLTEPVRRVTVTIFGTRLSVRKEEEHA